MSDEMAESRMPKSSAHQNPSTVKPLTQRPTYWGAWIERDRAGHRANMRQILSWCADGKLSPHVQAVYPLEEAAALAVRLHAAVGGMTTQGGKAR